jgi:hypothetical protein
MFALNGATDTTRLLAMLVELADSELPGVICAPCEKSTVARDGGGKALAGANVDQRERLEGVDARRSRVRSLAPCQLAV